MYMYTCMQLARISIDHERTVFYCMDLATQDLDDLP